MAREVTDAVRLKSAFVRRLKAIQAMVAAGGVREPHYTGVVEAMEACSNTKTIVADLLGMHVRKSTGVTQVVRLKRDFCKRLQAVQAMVIAGGASEPPPARIIEAMESRSDTGIIVEALIETWREPTLEQLRAAIVKARRSQKR